MSPVIGTAVIEAPGLCRRSQSPRSKSFCNLKYGCQYLLDALRHPPPLRQD